jgi:DNA-binding response OmpR family regulator
VGKRVLVVEDEQLVADLVADALALDGHITRCTSGDKALEAALDFGPDIILLDLMMPIVDGFEVARRLRAEPRTCELPIVVMTAMHDAATRGREIDTTHVLAKPFDIEDLLSTVQAIAR